MAHRVVPQNSESLVAQLLIKGQCLEIERITMRMNAAPGQGFTFRGGHEAAANAALPIIFRHPELLDKQPVPMGVSDQATNNDAVASGKHGETPIIF